MRKESPTKARLKRAIQFKIGSARAKELLRARIAANVEGKAVQPGVSLEEALSSAGINLFGAEGRGFQSLSDEVATNKCEVLWVNDPSDSREKLIRFVRLLRVSLLMKSTAGTHIFELIEVHRDVTSIEELELPESERTFEREGIGVPLTAKISLDEHDVLGCCHKLLTERLGLSASWQEKFLIPYDIEYPGGLDSYVEERDSKNYPGLPSWYLIDEYTFTVDRHREGLEAGNLLGLPNDAKFETDFTTEHEYTIYSWEWQKRPPTNRRSSIARSSISTPLPGNESDYSALSDAAPKGRPRRARQSLV